VNVNGIPLKLVDTAGIRETEDVVERIGVERSREALNNAELILYLLDNTQGFSSEDEEILDVLKDRNVIIIVNKIDLDGKIDIKINNKYKTNKKLVHIIVQLTIVIYHKQKQQKMHSLTVFYCLLVSQKLF